MASGGDLCTAGRAVAVMSPCLDVENDLIKRRFVIHGEPTVSDNRRCVMGNGDSETRGKPQTWDLGELSPRDPEHHLELS